MYPIRVSIISNRLSPWWLDSIEKIEGLSTRETPKRRVRVCRQRTAVPCVNLDVVGRYVFPLKVLSVLVFRFFPPPTKLIGAPLNLDVRHVSTYDLMRTGPIHVVTIFSKVYFFLPKSEYTLFQTSWTWRLSPSRTPHLSKVAGLCRGKGRFFSN